MVDGVDRDDRGEHGTRRQGAGGRRLEILRQRHRILRAIRGFFDGRGFVEVETPAMVPSPGLDVHLDAFEVHGGKAPRYLHTSPEYQMKRLVAEGVVPIYQLCKAFRRDERGSNHNPEFTILEWYRRGTVCEDLMEDTEALLRHVAHELHGAPQLPGVGAGGIDLSSPFERLTVRDAFRRYADVEVDDVLPDEERFFRLFVDRVEPELGRGRPTFLYRYPASMASLARLCDDDPGVAERMEAYVDGIELCNGFGELTDPVLQRQRLLEDQRRRNELGRPVYPLDEAFLQSVHALPECVGNAVGVDRLIMLALGIPHIDDVLSFNADTV